MPNRRPCAVLRIISVRSLILLYRMFYFVVSLRPCLYLKREIVSRQPYGLSADVWSLGCMLYTMLVGRPPFEDEQVKGTLDRVSRADYELPAWLSAEARDLIEQLLQKAPEHRMAVDRILLHDFFRYPSVPLRRPLRAPRALSSSKSKSTVSRLSTLRLKPLKQKTKHGDVEILSSGSVVLDFVGDTYRMVVSGDGASVAFYPTPSCKTNWDPSEQKPLREYACDQLPEKYSKKLNYAVRFVDVVRSKTPKVSLMRERRKKVFQCCWIRSCFTLRSENVFSWRMHRLKMRKCISTTALNYNGLPPKPKSLSFIPCGSRIRALLLLHPIRRRWCTRLGWSR